MPCVEAVREERFFDYAAARPRSWDAENRAAASLRMTEPLVDCRGQVRGAIALAMAEHSYKA